MAAVAFPTGTETRSGPTAAADQEWRLAMRCAMVAGLAFCIDSALLRIGVTVGFSLAVARCISLLAAMQVAFLLNGLLVFRRLDVRRCHLQWASYMASSGVGGACNYLIFVGLLAGPIPWLAHPVAAMVTGGVVGWLINYTGSRFIVFATRAPVPQSRSAQPRSAPEVPARRLGQLERSW